MKIGVITVCRNAAATLGDTLRSVAAQDDGAVEHPDAGTAADFDWMIRFLRVHRFTAVRLAPTLVTMRAGGVSNAGFASVARANAQARASLRRHRVASATPLLWAKYAAKSWQLVARPRDWPAPAAVRWPKPREGTP